MRDESGALPEALPTARARKWLLPSVDSAVSCEVRSHSKGFAAVSAGVRLFPGVSTEVQGQRRALAETFGAVGAGEGPLSGVHTSVNSQV